MEQHTIILSLRSLKSKYEKEGLIIEGLFGSYARGDTDKNSDIDILIHTEPKFTQTYGMRSIRRLNEIKQELSDYFNIPVDLASSSGMGQSAKKFILEKAIYI